MENVTQLKWKDSLYKPGKGITYYWKFGAQISMQDPNKVRSTIRLLLPRLNMNPGAKTMIEK